jgi:hypothetical protein
MSKRFVGGVTGCPVLATTRSASSSRQSGGLLRERRQQTEFGWRGRKRVQAISPRETKIVASFQ